jgi:pyruvate dehydrogenase E2 component (dihydrolipoamide acetyltransferase)
VDGFDLLNLKRTLSMAAAKRRLHGISVTDMLLKALGLAIVEHPEVNVSWEDGQIRVHEDVTIGLAVAVEDGLLVPTLADVDHLSLLEIARRRRDLVDRARLGQLRSGDLRAASLTLSNLGMYGIDQFHAILNPPESLILATGRIKDRLVVAGGNAVVRPTLWCTLSVDHRALDGTQVARFFDSLAVILENPGLLLLGGSEDHVEKQA